MDDEIKNWSLPNDSKKVVEEKFKQLLKKLKEPRAQVI
jgi:hypothetical protein